MIFGSKSLWVVLRENHEFSRFDFVAVCTSEDKAAERCQDANDFYIETEPNREISADAEAVYPLR